MYMKATIWFLTWISYGLVVTTTGRCPLDCHCSESRGLSIKCRASVENNGTVLMEGSAVGASAILLELNAYKLGNLSGNLKFVRLTELRLKNDSISDIADGFFDRVKSLQWLDVSDNCLSHLSCETFAGLTNLIHLDVSKNKLIKIDGAFGKLKMLRVLNLGGNMLFNITEDTFSNLPNLRHLNLQSNSLKILDASTSFVALFKLQSLNLRRNCFERIDKLTVLSNRFLFVDLSDTCLDKIPQSMTSSVSELLLFNNNITVISDGDLESYPHLKRLDLANNDLRYIEEDSFGRLQIIESLNLSANSLREVPRRLPTVLKILNMFNNALEVISNDTFAEVPLINVLVLSQNRISRVSICAFCGLRKLTSLDLSMNRISVLQRGLFDDLVELTNLSLSHNPIKSIEKYSLISLSRCRSLDVSSLPKLVDVNTNILDPMISLERLNISSSPKLFESILLSLALSDRLTHLTSLDVTYNENIVVDGETVRKIQSGVKYLKYDGTRFICNQKEISSMIDDNKLCAVIQYYKSNEEKTTAVPPPPPPLANHSSTDASVFVGTLPAKVIVSSRHDGKNGSSMNFLESGDDLFGELPTTNAGGNVFRSSRVNSSGYGVGVVGALKDPRRQERRQYFRISSQSITIIFLGTLASLVLVCLLYIVRAPIRNFIADVGRFNRTRRINGRAVYQSCNDNLSVINLSDVHSRPSNVHDDVDYIHYSMSCCDRSECQSRNLLANKYNDDLFVDLT